MIIVIVLFIIIFCIILASSSSNVPTEIKKDNKNDNKKNNKIININFPEFDLTKVDFTEKCINIFLKDYQTKSLEIKEKKPKFLLDYIGFIQAQNDKVDFSYKSVKFSLKSDNLYLERDGLKIANQEILLDFLFKQDVLLDFAYSMISSNTLLSYFIIKKHFMLVDSINITTDKLKTIENKNFYSNLEKKADKYFELIFKQVKQDYDSSIIFEIDEFIGYQKCLGSLIKLKDILLKIGNNGFIYYPYENLKKDKEWGHTRYEENPYHKTSDMLGRARTQNLYIAFTQGKITDLLYDLVGNYLEIFKDHKCFSKVPIPYRKFSNMLIKDTIYFIDKVLEIYLLVYPKIFFFLNIVDITEDIELFTDDLYLSERKKYDKYIHYLTYIENCEKYYTISDIMKDEERYGA